MSEESGSALLLDQQVCFSLYSASNAMVRSYRPFLNKLDLTYLQYIVMMVLWEKDGIGVTELGERMHLDSGTLTPLLKRLEAKGLVERRVSKKDERAKCLCLTESGKQLKTQAEVIPEQMMCQFSLTPEKLIALKAQCDDLLSLMNPVG